MLTSEDVSAAIQKLYSHFDGETINGSTASVTRRVITKKTLCKQHVNTIVVFAAGRETRRLNVACSEISVTFTFLAETAWNAQICSTNSKIFLDSVS